MQQTAVDFRPHGIDIYSALYLLCRALCENSICLTQKNIIAVVLRQKFVSIFQIRIFFIKNCLKLDPGVQDFMILTKPLEKFYETKIATT